MLWNLTKKNTGYKMSEFKFEIRKAERKKARLRLGLAAVSGAGKTYSALLLASGIGGKVCVIDTESRSADLYANDFEYSVIELSKPYSPERYVQAIKSAEDAGFNIIILDSLSHAWMGEGGALDMQTNAIRMQKGSKNGYTAWADVTPEHNKLVAAMLTSKCHIISTMRSKTHYDLIENEHGKKVPTKMGLEPIQRAGMEYEFTVVLDIDMQHYASPSKDRTKLFDGKAIKITKETGESLLNWLETGKDEEAETRAIIDALIDDFENKYKLCDNLSELKNLFAINWTSLSKYKNSYASDKMAAIKLLYDKRKIKLENKNEANNDTTTLQTNEPIPASS